MKNRFNIRGEITAVYVSFRESLVECIIDTKSLEILQDFDGTFRGVWNETVNGIYVLGYDLSYVPKRNTMIHRYLKGVEENDVVDHINHNTLDNRMENLKITTQSGNMLNKDPSKPSYKKEAGITWYESKNKWRVQLKRNGIYKHFGYYTEYEKALEALNNSK